AEPAKMLTRTNRDAMKTISLPWFTRSPPSVRLLSGAGQSAADHQPLDVAGALVNLADPDIAIDALDRKVGEITVAAMNLDGVRAYAFGHFRRKQFGHAGLFQTGTAGILQSRGVQHHLPAGLDAGSHVSQPEGDGLMVDDGRAEGLPLAGIGQRRLKGRPGHADRLGADADAAGFEIGQRDAVTLSLLTQQDVVADHQIVEDDLAGIRTMLAQLALHAG